MTKPLPYFLLFTLAIAVANSARGDEADERFLEGLRQRRLFFLAETFCRDRLSAAAMPLPDATRLTVERLRNLAEHAAHSRPDERTKLIEAACTVAADFIRLHPTSSQTFLVRTQDALTILAVGEVSRQEAEVGGQNETALENAKTLLRSAARLLEQLEKELAQAVALRARKPVADEELTLDELTALANHVRFQQARTLRNQALCYADGTEDRVAALALSAAQLEKVRSQIAPDDPLGWRIRLDHSVCLRLLGKLAEAQALVSVESFATSPAVWQPSATAERLRIHLAEPNLPTAEKILQQVQDVSGPRQADLDLAVLETLFALWQAADKASNRMQSAAWQKQTVEWIEMLERTHGAYWRRRAELLLVRAASGTRGDANVELVARSADSLYLQGQFDEAISAYEKAATMLGSAQEVQRRFDLLFKAALIEQKREHWTEASRRLRELSLANKTLGKAAEGHLLAAWSAAQQARQDAAATDFYRELLQENIATWPEQAAANQARLWLGNWHESRRNWAAVVAALRDVPRGSPHFENSLAALARCWPLRLAELRSQKKSTDSEALAAVNYFSAALRADADKWPMNWTESQRMISLVLARVQLEFMRDAHRAAEELLRAALGGQPPPAGEWKSAAQSLLVVAVAGQAGRNADASQLIEQITAGSPQQMLSLVQSLSKLIAGSAKQTSEVSKTSEVYALAKLQLQVLDQLQTRRDQLPEAAKQEFDRLRAEALATAGRREAAVTAFEQLAKRFPDDGALQERYAAFLLEGQDVVSWRRALDQWRIVASRSPPHTAQWFRAKYSVAVAQFRLGEKKSAAQLIRFLMETPPGLDGSDLKPQFVELLKKCES